MLSSSSLIAGKSIGNDAGREVATLIGVILGVEGSISRSCDDQAVD